MSALEKEIERERLSVAALIPLHSFIKALLENEMMTAYQIKVCQIINTLVWFLHPYFLDKIRA